MQQQPSRITNPTRPITGHKPHRYVPAASTDIRITFEKFRRLIRLQERANAR
jgi:hypothetical protein